MSSPAAAGVPEPEPYGHWAALRRASPVQWSPRFEAWLVLGYEAGFAAFRARSLSTDAYRRFRPAPVPLAASFEHPRRANRELRKAIASALPPRAWFRALLAPASRRVLERAAAARRVDFVADVAEPLARAWLEALLGLDSRRAAELVALACLAHAEADAARRQAAGALLRDGLIAEIEGRRSDPGEDLLSAMAPAWRQAGASDADLAAFVAPVVFSVAQRRGAQLLTCAALALSENPEALEAGPSVRALIREAARWEPVNAAAPRRVERPLDLAGAHLARNDLVLVVLPAVCHDPARHPDPARFDPTRRETSLAFGLGEHRCLGQDLALTASETALRELQAAGLRLSPSPHDSPRFEVDLGRTCTSLPLLIE